MASIVWKRYQIGTVVMYMIQNVVYNQTGSL